ncbi:MAG TPA: hypothetical protein VFQ61_13040 [Polyangiaceae bacterium]|nr:hypothetical protein [Polyangiaceae bacterium]
MTEEHLSALLSAAEAKKNDQGFLQPSEGRTITLYMASGGASLQVSKIEALRTERDLVHARTTKGELFVLALVDVFAGSVDGPSSGGRKAGFAAER